MIRTQIQLTSEQYQKLKDLSKISEQPIAALIRKAVDQYLENANLTRQDLYNQAQTVIGKYTASHEDISVNHDRYLDDAFKA